MSLRDDYARCRQIAHSRGKNFSVGMRTLPRGKREATYAVYAFCRVADDYADESESPEDSLARWQEELNRIYAGRPETPVGRALADAAGRYPISREPFERLIAGGLRDQRQNRYRTRADLEVYIAEVAWSISDLTLPIFGFRDSSAPRYGRELATALQMTNIVRDVGEDARRGRIYLPLDTLVRYGAAEDDVLGRRSREPLLCAIEHEAAIAQAAFVRSRPLLALVQRDCRRAVFLFGWVYRRVLARVLRDPATALI